MGQAQNLSQSRVKLVGLNVTGEDKMGNYYSFATGQAHYSHKEKQISPNKITAGRDKAVFPVTERDFSDSPVNTLLGRRFRINARDPISESLRQDMGIPKNCHRQVTQALAHL